MVLDCQYVRLVADLGQSSTYKLTRKRHEMRFIGTDSERQNEWRVAVNSPLEGGETTNYTKYSVVTGATDRHRIRTEAGGAAWRYGLCIASDYHAALLLTVRHGEGDTEQHGATDAT